ncbi:MAG: cytochrome c [Elusimicrobia bacterium]|nr:cytochrome c [Elusimicrobiota bacterium]
MGSLKLVGLVAATWVGLIGFYVFLAYRARLWSPLWAISPTTKVFAITPMGPAKEEGSLAVARGRLIYQSFRCGVCHGPNGEGGVKNPNADADPEGLVPNMHDLAESFTVADLKDKILKGAHTAKADDAGPEPPMDMPAWRKDLPDAEMDDLARYLFSIKSSSAADAGRSGEEKQSEPDQG